MADKTIKAALFGATGYGGNELLRILLPSEDVEFIALVSSSSAGKKLSDVCPHFAGTGLKLVSPEDETWKQADVVFLALPHGGAQKFVPKVPESAKIIDFSGDFRIKDLSVFEAFYGFAHLAPALNETSVYGLPEINRPAIPGARLVANPGCFASTVILALHPIVKSGRAEKAYATALTGSSGIGRKPAEGAHHPVRNHNIKAYKVGDHRHLPEIRQALDFQAVDFVPHSAPMTRGIFVSAFVRLNAPLTQADVEDIYAETFGDEPFIRMRKTVQMAEVAGSNLVDISLTVLDPHTLHVSAALDNLVKGAAGCAVQNLNLLFGRPETTDLGRLLPVYP